MRDSFPDDFIWGAATSSFQIEGATRADGRGQSIWDTFCATPGKVANGDTGDPACDHYNHVAEDVSIMRNLGLQSYRFSIAWPRIMPTGRGAINGNGLDFYKRLVDSLLDAGIKPMATLYHWDLPQSLQDAGGWASRDTAKRFADYSYALFEELGDVVGLWVTINEPAVVSILGHVTGEMAPGHTSVAEGMQVGHNLLLAHGLAVQAFRQSAAASARTNGGAGRIGITLSLGINDPATDRDCDIEAARLADGMWDRFYLDALFKNGYPEDVIMWLADRGHMPNENGLVEQFAADGDVIQAPMDFLGINYYTRNMVRRDDEAKPFQATGSAMPGAAVTAMGWEIYPEGLFRVVKRISDNYTGLPLMITENGAAYDDVLQLDGSTVDDAVRVDYLKAHFEQAARLCDSGVNLVGYYVWSLLDNFEWAFGYSRRFGIVHVDFGTGKRTMKKSALWYRDWIAGIKRR